MMWDDDDLPWLEEDPWDRLDRIEREREQSELRVIDDLDELDELREVLDAPLDTPHETQDQAPHTTTQGDA
jgi:hypothetical protein